MRANPGRAAIAVLAAVLAVALLSACGSPGDDGQSATSYEAGQTETTERPDRQSSIAAQEQDQAGQTTAESEPTEAEPDDDGAVVEVLRRHRTGLQADRNIVGDPDAPITIVEYSDFQ